MKHLFFFLLALGSVALSVQSYSVASPNGNLLIEIGTSPRMTWQLFVRNQPVTDPAPMALTIDGAGVLGNNPVVVQTDKKGVTQDVQPVVHQKSASIPEHYNELTLRCKGDWGISFRAYDEGVAYRFFTGMGKDIKVTDETFAFKPIDCKTIWFPEEETFYSHNERLFKPLAPAEINGSRFASLPAMAVLNSGLNILITETDLQNYPGLWLTGTAAKDGQLRGIFPYVPKNTVELSDRDIKPVDRERYMADTKGTRSFPWRLFLVAPKDADLLTNQMPYLLAEPSKLAETGWIRPGKVAWDWWNNLNVYGVDFRAGVNTATYKYFVDFAAENGLEYIILDEGWSVGGHLNQVNPDLNMDELAKYARQKKVGIILWVTWSTIDPQFDALLPNLKKWDIKGLKIDFMQRDDQPAVEFYWRMAEKGAKNHLLMDFHGAHKPAGLQRTWPNVLSFEGVFGLENSKWDTEKRIGPEHNVTLPFLRMVAGPMDYTPGAMLNAQKNDWHPIFDRPMALGTRCHELAKYVIFESPLQMLADSPTNYRKEPECLRFLAGVPSVWEQTVALDAKVGDYIAMARQTTGGKWYVGAMTDWTPRQLKLSTAFLPKGEYEIEWYADGINADRCAQDYRHGTGRIKSGDVLTADLAPGGGYVAILKKL
jgi:alpha-glucosidase